MEYTVVLSVDYCHWADHTDRSPSVQAHRTLSPGTVSSNWESWRVNTPPLSQSGTREGQDTSWRHELYTWTMTLACLFQAVWTIYLLKRLTVQALIKLADGSGVAKGHHNQGTSGRLPRFQVLNIHVVRLKVIYCIIFLIYWLQCCERKSWYT